VPEDCVSVATYGFGISYSEVNDLFDKEEELYKKAKKTFSNFIARMP